MTRLPRRHSKFSTLNGHPQREDFIDFQVSDSWREHYYQQGYTPIQPKKRAPALQGEFQQVLGAIVREEARGALAFENLLQEVERIREELEPNLLPRKPDRRSPTTKNRESWGGVPEDQVS